MKKKILYAALTLVVLLGLIIALAPARAIFPFITEKVAGLSLSQPEGTLWSSQISKAGYRGVELSNIELELSPASLLAGSLGGQLKVDDPSVRLDTDFSASNELLVVSNSEFEIDAAWLKQTAKMPVERLSGEIFGNIEQAEFQHIARKITALTATASWNNASFAVRNYSLQLGDLEFALSNKDEQTIEIKIINNNGRLDLKGNLILDMGKNYSLDINMSDDLPQDIAPMVKAFGKLENNRVYIKWRGKLP